LSVEYTQTPRPKSAGVIYLGTNGRIPAKSTTHMEVACNLWEDKERGYEHNLMRVELNNRLAKINIYTKVPRRQW
jgi:hypothetical protein